jgi:hypothetical protein
MKKKEIGHLFALNAGSKLAKITPFIYMVELGKQKRNKKGFTQISKP